ncbi:MAG: GGDEF domain-containing phosphodiesterase [Lachnospiraceae bacterium]|nr:GGDEF domain-containing phosphodiesterase [Lachnospiraceae bacterium]
MKSTSNRKNIIYILVLSVAAAILSALPPVLSARGVTIKMGSFVMVASQLSGIFTSIRLILLVIIVLIGKKAGMIISFVIIGVSSIPSLPEMIFQRSYNSLPGLAGNICAIIILYILYDFIKNINIYNRMLHMLSQQDPLTGMHNLTAVRDDIEKRIKNGDTFYVSFLYIENFGAINDMMGRDFGNTVLKTLAGRLIGNTVEGEYGGKNGDSEFVLVVNVAKDCQNPVAEREEVASRLRQFIKQVKRPLIIENTEITLEPRAAVVKYPDDGNDINELYRHLDDTIAHYRNQSKMELAFYDANVTNELTENSKIEDRLFRALSTDEIHLVFQPQFDLETGNLRGFETLSRLEDENGKPIRPDKFIAVAEKTNLIFRIDNWVLLHAIKTFKDVVKKHPDLIISVNISANHLQKPGYADYVLRILRDNDFPNKNLEIEITETVFAASIDTVREALTKLRDNQVKVALDDFGTGYASLSYLSQLPVNLLKIDKTFIDKMDNSDMDKDFIKLIISMGHVLHTKVLAEGVENEKEKAALQEWGCDMVQGYLTGKPMEFEKALEII